MSKQNELAQLADAVTVSGSNVGIGTSSPDAPLDVTRSGDGTIAILQNTGNHGFEISAPSSTTLQIASRQGSKNLDLWANTLSFSAGGSQRMAIDASGRVTMPNQPSCYVRGNSGGPWETNDVVIFNGVDTNIGNCYNTSNGRFTAPVNGRYMFSFIAMAPAFFRGQIRKNGAAQTEFRSDHDGATALNYVQKSITVIYSMSVGDYVDQYISAGIMNGNGNEVQMHAHLLS